MSARSLAAAAFVSVTVAFANNAGAHWSGIDLCDEVDGVDYMAAKEILRKKNWVPDIPKLPDQSQTSQAPELSCVKDETTPCEITFRRDKGFVVLVVKKYGPDDFAVQKCY